MTSHRLDFNYTLMFIVVLLMAFQYRLLVYKYFGLSCDCMSDIIGFMVIVATRYADCMSDIYQATYGTYDSTCPDTNNRLWEHPFERFDAGPPIAHVDRVGFRIPDKDARRG